MKTDDKSLLIHHDTVSDKSSGIIVDERDVVKKTKEFLKKIAKSYKSAEVNVYQPIGVVLKAKDDEHEYAQAVAYEREKFVIVEPGGASGSAKLYGNWNEALASAQRLLTRNSANKKVSIVLDRYFKKD